MSPSISLKTVISLALVVLIAPAAIDMYLASMPEMAKELNTSYATAQITLTVFLIFLGLGQLFFGPISDTYGRKIPLITGLLLYVSASVWAATASTIDMLIYARAVQGLGAATAIVAVMSMVRDLVEGEAATQIYALLNTLVVLGPIVAPALGGFMSEHYGWRGIMLALAGGGTLVLLNSLLSIKESLPEPKRVALNFKTVCATYWSIFKNKLFLFNLLALAAVYFFLFAYISGSPYVYQHNFGLSPQQFGLVFGLTSISLVLGAFSSVLAIKKLPVAHIAAFGAVLMMCGSAMCIATHFFQLGVNGIVIGMALGLFGLGILDAVLMGIAMNSQSIALGASAALLGSFPMLIASLATPVAGYLVVMGTLYWLFFLGAIGPIILALVFLGTRGTPTQAEAV